MTETYVRPHRVAIWPDTPEGLAECEAYIAWSNANAPEWWLQGAIFQQVEVRRDFYHQPWAAVCEYRPDWDAPEGEATMRPHAVIHDTIVPPPSEYD
jgi:hypothetical protein